MPRYPRFDVRRLVRLASTAAFALPVRAAQSQRALPPGVSVAAVSSSGQPVSGIHVSPPPPPARGAERVWRALVPLRHDAL